MAGDTRRDDRRGSRSGRAQPVPARVGPESALPRYRLVGESGTPPPRRGDRTAPRSLPRPTWKNGLPRLIGSCHGKERTMLGTTMLTTMIAYNDLTNTRILECAAK